jgi:ATP-binding cassette, subfamily B, bacterial
LTTDSAHANQRAPSSTPRGVDRSVLRRGLAVLGRAIREQPRIFAIAVLGGAVYGSTTVATAWVLGQVTNRVLLPAFRDGRTTTAALVATGLAIVGVAVLKAAGIVARRLGAGVMQYRLQASYRRRVTRQYLRLPLAWHHRHPTGELLSNANSDVESIWYPIAPLPMAVGVLIMLGVAGIAMIATDLPLALIGFLVFPALFGLNLVYQRRLAPLAMRAQQLRADLSTTAHESFDAALVVKTLGREDAELQRFAVDAHALRDANVAIGRVRGLFDPVLEVLPNLGVLAVLLVGAWRLERGSLSPGELVQIAYLFTLIAWPVRAIGWVLGELPRSVVGWDRVTRVLSATGALPYGPHVLERRSTAARLDVRDVRFRYDGVDVLHEVSFDVAPGRTVALIGPTGAGKSTLASLLVRLVDPDSGQVLLDDTDLRQLERGEVAANAALVPQQTFLFDDTVRGNVAFGLAIGDAEVWAALRTAQADGFVAALPQALDTPIGERGFTLSGGQRQRLALARALVRKPRLLILDDATSSVDPDVESRILAGLSTAAAESSVVVVAYRRATISLADEVVLLDHGRVVDRGSHVELLGRSELYRKLLTAYDREDEERRSLDADAVNEVT